MGRRPQVGYPVAIVGGITGAVVGVLGGIVGGSASIVASGVIGGALGALLAWLLCAWKREATRTGVFAYDAFVVVALVALALWYLHPELDWSLASLVPVLLRGQPISAIWFGALGGATISLKGVYDHNQDQWEPQLNLWHFGRPITSSVSGGMSYIFLRLISGTEPKDVAVYAAAFIVGLQEKRFLALLSKVGSLIFGTPDAKEPGSSTHILDGDRENTP